MILKRLLLFTLFIFFAVASTALAEITPPANNELNLPSVQFWAVVLGALAPLVSYILNHYAPWATEKVKAIVQVAVAAAVGTIYDLISSGNFALDTKHLQVVGSAIVAALLAHKLLYVPGAINAALGGGTNVQDNPAR